MRYFYNKPSEYSVKHGETYVCDSPVYNKCTLYKSKDKGLAVIQQRYNPISKTTRWGEIDEWLVDDIFNNPSFDDYFEARSGKPTDGVYPTVTVRQIMWSLRMKPIKKAQWETTFDRPFI